MQTTRLMVGVTFCAALLYAPVSVVAETYTFTGTASDTWDDRFNWDPDTGPPVAGDTAIIPSGKTCIISVADQAAEVIDVGGTLGLDEKNLTLGDPIFPTTSTVDGTIWFDMVFGPLRGVLLIGDEVTMNGTGKLTARADDGRAGRIDVAIASFNPQILILGSGMTIEGTFLITCGLELNGTAVVDHADDVMRIGQTVFTAGGEAMRGSGEFQVSEGLLKFAKKNYGSTLPKLTLSEGKIEFIDVPFNESTFLNLTFAITMTGGTLEINDPFDTSAECKFRGGTIKVADGKVAEFIRPAP